MDKSRPMGVTIISVINLLIGLCYFLISFFWFYSGGIHVVKLVFYIFCSLTVALIGLSTFYLRWESLVSNIVFSVIGIMNILRTYVLLAHQKDFIGKPNKVLELIIFCSLATLYFIWVIVYLNRRKVKEQFSHQAL